MVLSDIASKYGVYIYILQIGLTDLKSLMTGPKTQDRLSNDRSSFEKTDSSTVRVF